MKLFFLKKIEILEVYDNIPLRSEHITMYAPAVAVTKDYFSHKKAVKFSRANLYLRDMYQCQYCGGTFDHKLLTIDHVVPRKDGGVTNWENCASSCIACNGKKGHKLWKPLNVPCKPDYYNLVKKWKIRSVHINHPSWNIYLGL
jgi:5-methylcytosine-specific restriction endonuclease McrA